MSKVEVVTLFFKTTVEGSKNDLGRSARSEDMLFEVMEIEKSGNRMRMSCFKEESGREIWNGRE